MAFDTSGLGKSLDNVFARTARRDQNTGRGVQEIDINLIMPAANNPRKAFNEKSLQELSQSIKLHGVLQPLVVVKKDGGYEIVAGERRYRASRLAGLERVPVVLRSAEADEQALAELRLIENIQREDLNPIDLALAYKELIDDHKLTQEQLGERLGKERSSITNSLRLLTFNETLRHHIAAGKLSIGQAKVLLAVKDEEAQLSLADQAIAKELTVRALERLVKEQIAISSNKKPSAKKKGKPSHIKELEGNLYRLFGAPVSIKERAGKGSLTVHFESKGAFKRVVDTLDKLLKESQRVQDEEER